MERSIRPCVFPGCRSVDGNPELTKDVICARSRRHYRRLLTEWLPLDYVTIKATLPKPVALGPRIRTTSSHSYGHPAEWASDTLRAIADALNGWEHALRDHLEQGAAVHPGHAEPRRVALAVRYLDNWFDHLCTFPGACLAAMEFSDLHRGVRAALGQGTQARHLPTPCPECHLLLLVRITDGRDDQVECRNPECGARIGAAHYGMWTRMLADEAIESATETQGCA